MFIIVSGRQKERSFSEYVNFKPNLIWRFFKFPDANGFIKNKFGGGGSFATESIDKKLELISIWFEF